MECPSNSNFLGPLRVGSSRIHRNIVRMVKQGPVGGNPAILCKHDVVQVDEDALSMPNTDRRSFLGRIESKSPNPNINNEINTLAGLLTLKAGINGNTACAIL